MSSEERDYYRRRAAQERQLAQAASRSEVAEIHEELARQYEALVELEELRPYRREQTIDDRTPIKIQRSERRQDH